MSRAVPEWVGRSDDTQAPPRVRLRVWTALKGLCGQCGRQIRAGESWTLEHITALINGGENRESNLGLTCCNCVNGKNAADVAEKATVARKRSKHLGIKPKGRGWAKAPPGYNPWTRRIDR